MSKYIAALLVLAAFSQVHCAPPAYASSVPSASVKDAVDPVALLQDTMNHLGKDKDHPYIIPYCAGESTLISAETGGFLPQSDPQGNATLPENVHVLMVDVDTPVNLENYNNALGALIIDMQMPDSHPEWANNLNITGLIFTSNTSEKFDSQNLLSADPSTKVVMQMAFSFISEFNSSDSGSVYACITSPFVRMPLPDSVNDTTPMSSKDAGNYMVELGYMLSVGPAVNVSEIYFSDVYLTCLPAPTETELADQNITFWKKETSPGKYVLSPALAAAQ